MKKSNRRGSPGGRIALEGKSGKIAVVQARQLFQRTVALIFLSIFFLAASPGFARANTVWEVAVVFLGAEEDADYQADIDADMRELASLPVGERLKLSVYRDFADRAVTFQPDPSATESTPWDPLFGVSEPSGLPIYGRLTSRKKSAIEGPVARNPERLADFLRSAFRDPSARRLLVVWGHGYGVDGIQGFSLPELRELLSGAVPARAGKKPLDLLWFDSCFMATVEVAYEFMEQAELMLASEAAEFSTGLPFETLAELVEFPERTIRDTATSLARKFVASYSYLRLGRQRTAASTSPATISVLDLARISGLVEKLAELVARQGRLGPEARRELVIRRSTRATGLEAQADLVSFLQHLRESAVLKEPAETLAREALFRLEGFREWRLATDLRIRVVPPAGQHEVWLVYGYNDWIYGAEGDQATAEKLADEMKPAGFVVGAFGLRWPYIVVRQARDLVAFGVDRNKFHYYFVDPKTGQRLSDENIMYRFPDQELIEFHARNPENPVLYSAYTQGRGGHAERYFGLSIFDRAFAASPGLLESRFSRRTKWGNF